MNRLGWICLLLTLLEPAMAQAANPIRHLRELSVRWAEYYATVYRVPVELVEAIISEESGWDSYAVSQKGAVGLMQLMPQTAVRFGVRNRFRADENIRAGVAYLAFLSREFGGDLRLVTAAYYVGEGPIRVRKLDYCSADVEAYVKRVAVKYRARRRRKLRLKPASGTEEGVEDARR